MVPHSQMSRGEAKHHGGGVPVDGTNPGQRIAGSVLLVVGFFTVLWGGVAWVACALAAVAVAAAEMSMFLHHPLDIAATAVIFLTILRYSM